jgi:hypothetical protein
VLDIAAKQIVGQQRLADDIRPLEKTKSAIKSLRQPKQWKPPKPQPAPTPASPSPAAAGKLVPNAASTSSKLRSHVTKSDTQLVGTNKHADEDDTEQGDDSRPGSRQERMSLLHTVRASVQTAEGATWGFAPLHFAVANYRRFGNSMMNIIELLIKFDADVNVPGYVGLHGARFSTEIQTRECRWFPHLLG